MSKNPLQMRINKRGETDQNAPLREFDELTGEFEYVDLESKKKSQFRKARKRIRDVLADKQEGLKKHLERAGLEEKMGKTGNSLTGKVSAENKQVAHIQQEHSKVYIKRYKDR